MKLVMKKMALVWKALGAVYILSVELVAALLSLVSNTWRTAELLRDAYHAGALVFGRRNPSCPKGHELAQEGVFTCARCGFVYEGSVWICSNPECRAVTPYTNCIICGQSIRSPWRWGRP